MFPFRLIVPGRIIDHFGIQIWEIKIKMVGKKEGWERLEGILGVVWGGFEFWNIFFILILLWKVDIFRCY